MKSVNVCDGFANPAVCQTSGFHGAKEIMARVADLPAAAPAAFAEAVFALK